MGDNRRRHKGKNYFEALPSPIAKDFPATATPAVTQMKQQKKQLAERTTKNKKQNRQEKGSRNI